jgi:hypothetical protein
MLYYDNTLLHRLSAMVKMMMCSFVFHTAVKLKHFGFQKKSDVKIINYFPGLLAYRYHHYL